MLIFVTTVNIFKMRSLVSKASEIIIIISFFTEGWHHSCIKHSTSDMKRFLWQLYVCEVFLFAVGFYQPLRNVSTSGLLLFQLSQFPCSRDKEPTSIGVPSEILELQKCQQASLSQSGWLCPLALEQCACGYLHCS